MIGKLVPDHGRRRFEIEIVAGVSAEEMAEASEGTIRDGDVVYTLDGETYRTKFKTIRGDLRRSDGVTENKLRRWEKADFMPRPDDILQERLYCVQWITRSTLHKARQATFFAAVTMDDLDRERKIEELVRENLECWQHAGLVPDMEIEPGDKTNEPIRTRGWTHWHHLFNPRQLNALRAFRERSDAFPAGLIGFAKIADYGSRLCRWCCWASGVKPPSRGHIHKSGVKHACQLWMQVRVSLRGIISGQNWDLS